MTTPATIDRDAVKVWAKLDLARTDDDGVLDQVVAAVVAQVDAYPNAPRTADGGWADSTRLAAVMLAARLFKRRNSPQGVEAFTSEGAAVYVARYDPDIARILKVDTFSPPQVG